VRDPNAGADALDTYYDRPERQAPTEVALQREALRREPNVCAVLDLVPEPILVLNDHRQIVFPNRAASLLLAKSTSDLVGRRFGDAVQCVHAAELPHGCGTTPHCSACGAAHVLKLVKGGRHEAHDECRLAARRDDGAFDALDFRVSAAPLRVGPHRFTVLSLVDNADLVRRRVLERLFFHDVVNTAGGVLGLLGTMRDLDGIDAVLATSDLAVRLAAELMDEIEAQRDLTMAERGDLVADAQVVPVMPLLERLVQSYEHHAVAEGRRLSVDRVSPADARVTTDPALLRRVLGNLVKNALEATDKGGLVRLAFDGASSPTFRVSNPGVMPASAQLRVFQRSFSSKAGVGRGLGTYGARLFVENYLGGSIGFESTHAQGTTFTVTLPTDTTRPRG
jgi:PAS domain-containing protein